MGLVRLRYVLFLLDTFMFLPGIVSNGSEVSVCYRLGTVTCMHSSSQARGRLHITRLLGSCFLKLLADKREELLRCFHVNKSENYFGVETIDFAT